MYRSEERVTYQTLKEWALESYFNGCRDHAAMQGWQHAQVMGYVSHTFEDGFERPIEDLMWRVIILVLSGGWHQEIEQNIRRIIAKQLAERGLDSLLADVPVGEAEVFTHDLKILKLI